MAPRPTHCSMPECGRPHYSAGYCRPHYRAWKTHGDASLHKGRCPPSQRRHGHSFVNGKATSEYNAWSSMKRRCLNPSSHNYRLYGGRGIKVCKRWVDSFEAFYEDMGAKPSSKHSLDRFPNNDGDYEPGNCRWATNREQHRNKRTNHRYEFNGRMLCVVEIAEQSGTDLTLLRSRLKHGWSIERAVQ